MKGDIMKRKVLPDGSIKLSCKNGIIDTRNGNIYFSVICSPDMEHYFIENLIK